MGKIKEGKTDEKNMFLVQILKTAEEQKELLQL